MNRRLLCALSTLAMLLTASPATADDQGEVRLSPANPTWVKTYPSPLANNPAVTTGGDSCREDPGSEYCDVIDVTVQIPSGYSYNWALNIVLSWDNTGIDDDLDMYVYDGVTGNNLSGSTGATGTPPEKPRPTETVFLTNIDPATYNVMVHNFLSASETYELKVDFVQREKISTERRLPQAPRQPPDDSPPGQGSGGGFGGGGGTSGPFPTGPTTGDVPAGESGPGFQPLAVDAPEDRAPNARLGFRPTSGESAEGDLKVPWNRRRALTGLGLLGAIAVAAYLLFVLPRSRQRPREQVAAS